MTRLSTLLLPLAATPALAQSTVEYTLDAQSSSLQLNTAVGLDLTGDLRGVFDPATNAGGTRTQRGIFGDDGSNQEASLSLALSLGLDLGGALEGAFTLAIDPEVGSASVEGLALDLSGGPNLAGLDLILEYETFRTFNPGSLFLGGIPLPIPLGDVTIDNVRFEQNGSADGAVLPGAQFGQFDVAVNVPVGLSFDLEAGPILGGGVTPVGPVPVVLPLVVTVDRADCESLLSGGASESFSQSIPSPFPFAFDDLPFDLPTLLPPGGTANLLLSASLDGISLDGSVSLLVGAVSDDARVEDVCPGVANSTGFGADIAVVGSTSVANADMGLQVTGLPADTFGMLIMSRSQAFVPGFGGSQGDLCLGEPCYRYFDSVTGSGPAGEITVFPDFDALPQAQSFVELETWNFQLWYRDSNPGATSNASGALAVTFCR